MHGIPSGDSAPAHPGAGAALCLPVGPGLGGMRQPSRDREGSFLLSLVKAVVGIGAQRSVEGPLCPPHGPQLTSGAGRSRLALRGGSPSGADA